MEKPIKKYVTFNRFDRFEGHYDWCHLNEKQAQYVFVKNMILNMLNIKRWF
mgnify:CR=1 FL=1